MKLWSLYNREEKLRIDDLTVEHVRVILLSISSRRMKEWFACAEGQDQWLPLDSIRAFSEEATVTDKKPLKMAAGAEALTDPTLMVDLSATKERRSARRYNRKLGFQVQIGANSFSCQTSDVSMSGLSLDQDLPPWVPRSFQAQLSLNQHAVTIACEKVSPRKLKLTGSNSWDLIRQWIVNF